MNFWFRQPEIPCSHCDRIVAKARYPHKRFKLGAIVRAKDFKATKNCYKKKLIDGDEILCKHCYKKKFEVQKIPDIIVKKKKWWWPW